MAIYAEYGTFVYMDDLSITLAEVFLFLNKYSGPFIAIKQHLSDKIVLKKVTNFFMKKKGNYPSVIISSYSPTGAMVTTTAKTEV